MSIATATAPWPRTAGHVLAVPRPGAEAPALQWVLRRNCSATPSQLLAAYALLCASSLVVGLGFWLHGAGVVLAFAGLELLLVGAALLVYARHATDRETLTFAGRELLVEHHRGPVVERSAFRAEWLSVEPAMAQGSLVELSGEGRRVRVGRYVRPELRAALAQEIRLALRRVQAGLPPIEPKESELESQR